MSEVIPADEVMEIVKDTDAIGVQIMAESHENLRRAYANALQEAIWLREEVISQTGCTPEQLAECMAADGHRHVVNVRIGAEIKKRLELGEEARLLRDVATGARMALNNDFCHFMVSGLLKPPLNALCEWRIANTGSEEEA